MHDHAPWVAESPLTLQMGKVFIRLEDLTTAPVHLKIESFNPAGSIKLKPAIKMITALEERGRLHPGSELIESSSGNLGIALAMVCAQRGYRFTCVTDPVCSETSLKLIEAYGARVIVVTERDENEGFLNTRLRLIAGMLAENENLIWINQYANDNNWLSHTETTGPEILESFPRVDWLFIGAGTTGTLMGGLRYFREHSPKTRVIAVDSEGSLTFGGPGKRRHIPGLGTSRKPEITVLEEIPDVQMVPETDTVRMCHRYARQGLLFGGSTGTVLAGLCQYGTEIDPDDVVVAISPDLGERYLDTLYNPDWIREKFGTDFHSSLFSDTEPQR